MSKNRQIPGTEAKTKAPKPWSNGLSFPSLETVKMRIACAFERSQTKAFGEACKLRPQQYGVRILAYRPADRDWRYDKDRQKQVEVKIAARPEREVYATKGAKVSSVAINREWSRTKLTFALILPAEFAEKSAAIGTDEKMVVEISTPQLSLV